MENQIKFFFELVRSRFPNITFEVIRNSLSPGLIHFVIKDHEAKGFGSGNSQISAAEKAYSEFIERKTMFELNKMFSSFNTSNGFAAHPVRQQAIKNSRFELIERDAFLLMWHGKKAPYWIDGCDLTPTLNFESLEILKQHKRNGLDLRVGILAKSNSIYTAISCVRMSRNRFYIDTKSGDFLPEIINSLIESISFNSHYILKGYSSKKVRTLVQPMDHFNYYLAHRIGLDWFFKGSQDVILIPSENIVTKNCYANELLGTNTGRYVYYSESLSMQQYYCGKNFGKHLNSKRFQKVFGKSFQLNGQIHPLS